MVCLRSAGAGNSRGFTLLEIMIALAVFSVAIGVLLVTDGTSVKQTARVEEKVIASWLAEDYLNKVYLDKNWSRPGTQGNFHNYAERRWYVEQEIEAMGKDGFRKISIYIFRGDEEPDDDDAPLYSLSGFLRKPAA